MNLYFESGSCKSMQTYCRGWDHVEQSLDDMACDGIVSWGLRHFTTLWRLPFTSHCLIKKNLLSKLLHAYLKPTCFLCIILKCIWWRLFTLYSEKSPSSSKACRSSSRICSGEGSVDSGGGTCSYNGFPDTNKAFQSLINLAGTNLWKEEKGLLLCINQFQRIHVLKF